MLKKAVILLSVCFGCTPIKNDESVLKSTEEIIHAAKFYIETDGESDFLVVTEPWPGASINKRYKLDAPPTRLVCTSTSHLPYLELLGLEETIVGFPNLDYISSDVFVKRAEEGLITDLGTDGNLNLELILGLNPDAVIAFDMGGESNALDKIASAGIPVIYNSDFLEKNPLGRAEWIKFFGALLDRREQADSIFTFIETEYSRLTTIAEKYQEKPTILSGVVYGDSWFLPGGQNWASTFFKNAGGTYLWEKDTTSGWMELSFEAVYEAGVEADYWIGTSTFNSKKELLGQDDRYGTFKPMEQGQVYNYNKRIGPNGGYDFFESGYSRPDLVLADLIKILHPDALPDYETVYFQKLK